MKKLIPLLLLSLASCSTIPKKDVESLIHECAVGLYKQSKIKPCHTNQECLQDFYDIPACHEYNELILDRVEKIMKEDENGKEIQ